MSFNNLTTPLQSGSIIAMSPHSAPPETIVIFNGLEIKWHQSAANSFDGIAIRTQSGTRSLRYTSIEFYVANAAADAGKVLYGSNNAWYNLPNVGAVATVINAVYPYAQNVTTTFIGLGNPAMPNADYRKYVLYDDTNQATYLITIDKQASTGEVLSAQNGSCLIVVEKVGISTNQVITAAAPIALTGNQITYAAPYFRGQGTINIGDFSTATVVAAETTTGITASIVSGVGASPMVMQVNLPAGMVPDALYKVLPVITSNAGEAAGSNASVVFEIASGRATTGFRVIFRETIGVVQNCNFEFAILR